MTVYVIQIKKHFVFTYKCIIFVCIFKDQTMTEKDKFIKIITKAETNGFKFRNDR